MGPTHSLQEVKWFSQGQLEKKKKVKLTSNHAGPNSAVSVFGKDPAAFFFLKL
jgi:hypothetical protein